MHPTVEADPIQEPTAVAVRSGMIRAVGRALTVLPRMI
jgi:hypothetical protein